MNRMTNTLWRRCATLTLVLSLCAICATPISMGQESEPDPVEVQHRYGDRISIFGGDIDIPAGTSQRGLLLSVGGNVTVEGSTQEVIVIFGKLLVRGGTVNDQVVGVLSEIELTDAEIGGQLVNVLGSINQHGTRIDGPTLNISMLSWFPGITAAVFWCRVFLTLVAFIALLMLATICPDRVRVIGEAATERYIAAFFVGILGYLGLGIIFTLLVATVIGIPVALIGFYVFKWLGVAGIFFIVGQRVGRGFGLNMSLMGAVLASFAIFAALRLLPSAFGMPGLLLSLSLGTLFFLLIEVPAVGLVILTRLGSVSGPTGASTAPDFPSPSSAPPTNPIPAPESSPPAPSGSAPQDAAGTSPADDSGPR